MKSSIFAFALAALCTFAIPSQASAQTTVENQFKNIQVTLTDLATGQTFTGILDINQMVANNNGLMAVGTLTANGASRAVAIPAQLVEASCTILDLELGPLDLNLLGLRVQLAPVDLLITAEPAGGLLGALLCAVANLLNIGGLTQLLNQIIAIVDLLGNL